MLAIFLAAYGAVFLAEIAGDKLLYTTGYLATRYKPAPIMVGMAIAFMVKMAVAVAVGEAISQLSPWLVAAVTTVSFAAIAYTVWRKPVVAPVAGSEETAAPKAAMLSFAAVVFSEWGDVGQITAATVAARFNAPYVVWLGAVLAMITKGVLAASIGAGVRRWIQEKFSPKFIRVAGVVLLVGLALASVVETFEGHA